MCVCVCIGGDIDRGSDFFSRQADCIKCIRGMPMSLLERSSATGLIKRYCCTFGEIESIPSY